METTDLMNEQVIRQMILDTSTELLPELLSVFVAELDKHAELIQHAFESDNLFQVSEEAHAIKSCAGTFGAQRLYQVSMMLENDANSLQADLSLLHSQVTNLIEVLTATKSFYLDFNFEHLLPSKVS